MGLILANVSQRLTNTWGKRENLSENFQNVFFFLSPAASPAGFLTRWMRPCVSIHGEKTSRIVWVENVGAFYLPPFLLTFASGAFLFFTPAKMQKLYTRPVRQAKAQDGSRTAGNKQMCRNKHTQKQTSKTNRQAFCITFLLKKKKKSISSLDTQRQF